MIKEDQGMLLIMLDHFDIPLSVRKSDGKACDPTCSGSISDSALFLLFTGGYGYDSTDMAAIHYRLKTLVR